MALEVELVSPEQVLYTGDAMMVIVRTLGGGDIAFLTGHAPFLGALATWPIELVLEDGSQPCSRCTVASSRSSQDRVMILSDVAELSEYIDVERAAPGEDALRRDPRA